MYLPPRQLPILVSENAAALTTALEPALPETKARACAHAVPERIPQPAADFRRSRGFAQAARQGVLCTPRSRRPAGQLKRRGKQ